MKTGIVTPLWERGLSYVALNFYHALSEKHETGMLTFVSEIKGSPRLNVQGEFDVPNLCVYPRAEILPEDLRRWMERYDAVLFMEERFGNYIRVAKKLKKKTINYLCEPAHATENEWNTECDLLLSPNGVTGTEHVPLGVDVNLFKPKKRKKKKDEKIHVLVPLGWGGDYDRKNEKAIVAAISRVQCRDRIEALVHRHYGDPPGLLIDHQMQFLTTVAPRKDMPNLYAESDLCICQPKWGRNEIAAKEAMSCGIPVVNGAKTDHVERHDGVCTDASVPDVHDLATRIAELSEDEGELGRRKKEARQKALDLFNWETNKGTFLKLIEGV